MIQSPGTNEARTCTARLDTTKLRHLHATHQPEDTSPPLDAKGITRLQEVIGTLLYYARAVDSTMLVALGTLASVQTKGTEATAQAVTHLLN